MAMFEPIKIKSESGKEYNGYFCTGCETNIFQSQQADHRGTCHKDIPVRKKKSSYFCRECNEFRSAEHVYVHNG